MLFTHSLQQMKTHLETYDALFRHLRKKNICFVGVMQSICGNAIHVAKRPSYESNHNPDSYYLSWACYTCWGGDMVHVALVQPVSLRVASLPAYCFHLYKPPCMNTILLVDNEQKTKGVKFALPQDQTRLGLGYIIFRLLLFSCIRQGRLCYNNPYVLAAYIRTSMPAT